MRNNEGWSLGLWILDLDQVCIGWVLIIGVRLETKTNSEDDRGEVEDSKVWGCKVDDSGVWWVGLWSFSSFIEIKLTMEVIFHIYL